MNNSVRIRVGRACANCGKLVAGPVGGASAVQYVRQARMPVDWPMSWLPADRIRSGGKPASRAGSGYRTTVWPSRDRRRSGSCGDRFLARQHRKVAVFRPVDAIPGANTASAPASGAHSEREPFRRRIPMPYARRDRFRPFRHPEPGTRAGALSAKGDGFAPPNPSPATNIVNLILRIGDVETLL